MKQNKTMKGLIFLVVLLLPFIYGFFYLKSYWDPYGNLQDLPVAIVNLDQGEDGKNQGKELVQSLIDSNSVKICEVSQEQAQDGLIHGTYYAKIVIPEDFTASLNNAQEIEREKTIITFSPNKKTNYLAYQIINNVVSKTELNLQGKIANQVVASLKEKLEEVPEKMEEVKMGVGEVLEGTKTLKEGTNSLVNGTNTLQENYEKFDQGVKNAYQGSYTLKEGIHTISQGSTNLKEGIDTLHNGIVQIEEGIHTLATQTEGGFTNLTQGAGTLATGSTAFYEQFQQYLTGVNSLNGNTKQLVNAILAIGKQNPSILQDETFAKLYGAANQIAESGAFERIQVSGTALQNGYSTLHLGIQSLHQNMSGVKVISEGFHTLQEATNAIELGSSHLVEGSQTLQNGMTKISEGSQNLTNGMSVLHTSSKEVKNGIIALNHGSHQLANGMNTLENGVITLQEKIGEGIDTSRQELIKLKGLPEYTEDPIEIKEESYGKVEEYGVSFTPLFLSIGLWVGALMAYVVLYYDQEKRFQLFGKYAKNKYLQIGIYFIIAVMQGMVTGILLKIGLGFTVQNGFLYYSSCILIAIAFMSIIQFLIMNFGDVGKFLALVILVLQLAASGGTFPVETVHKGFQVLTPALPMTYSIKLLKESLVLIDQGFAMKNIMILLFFTIVPVAITLIVTSMKSRKQEVIEKEEKS